MEIDFCKYYWLYDVIKPVINGYVVVIFFKVIFIFSFVSTSLAYITIPKNKKKNKNYPK